MIFIITVVENFTAVLSVWERGYMDIKGMLYDNFIFITAILKITSTKTYGLFENAP